jgi:two-component system cell cycle sensor histidine kinase/response regulator CckA
VKADPGQIDQILMNLAVNARDAMPRGGRLTIETRNVEIDEVVGRQQRTVEPGRYVMLAVTDTGHGMTPEVGARIFEPFFTTKEVGKGTGLGLATVHGIVKQSDGHISVRSGAGQGTTFKIFLPRVDAPADVAASLGPAEAAVPGGSETVLLVEDETSLRQIVCETLEAAGYTVVPASSGKEAIEICEARRGGVDLLMTDVVMPRMSGRELADGLRLSHPELAILYMSGYTDDAVLLHGVLAEHVAFLQKPFRTDALVRKVREVLDRRILRVS